MAQKLSNSPEATKNDVIDAGLGAGAAGLLLAMGIFLTDGKQQSHQPKSAQPARNAVLSLNQPTTHHCDIQPDQKTITISRRPLQTDGLFSPADKALEAAACPPTKTPADLQNVFRAPDNDPAAVAEGVMIVSGTLAAAGIAMAAAGAAVAIRRRQ